MAAAARTRQQGDEIISREPRELVFGPENEIIDRITYEVFRRPDGSLDMGSTGRSSTTTTDFPRH